MLDFCFLFVLHVLGLFFIHFLDGTLDIEHYLIVCQTFLTFQGKSNGNISSINDQACSNLLFCLRFLYYLSHCYILLFLSYSCLRVMPLETILMRGKCEYAVVMGKRNFNGSYVWTTPSFDSRCSTKLLL